MFSSTTYIYILLALLGALLIIISLIKQIAFINDRNIEITKGTITQSSTTVINHFIHVDEYHYTYKVHGESFTGKDQNIRFLKEKIPSEISVKYLKNNPAQSQLCFINHTSKTITLLIILILLALASFVLYRHG